MAAVLKIPGAHITAAPLPVDPILNVGSLLLLEPGHVAEKTKTVPINNGVIANLAKVPSLALTGSALVNPTFTTDYGANPLAGTVELTAKGGLHFIQSRASGINGVGAGFNAQTGLTNYISTNVRHSYYLSVWGRYTSTPDNTAGTDGHPIFGFKANSLGEIQRLYYLQSINGIAGTPASASAERLGFSSSGTLTGGFRAAINGKDLDLTAPAMSPVLAKYAPTATAEVNKTPSFILYRAYIEDLTVSGRTFAQVEVVDAALYAEAFAAGGRYSGDTWTDPTTFA